jgi:hypothetical protein
MKNQTTTPQAAHLGWKIYSVAFTLLIILGLGWMLTDEGMGFEFYRNFISGVIGSFGLFFYAFNLSGIPNTAWKFILFYCAADALYDIPYIFKTEGLQALLVAYPFELAVLFPMFLALNRLADIAANRD